MESKVAVVHRSGIVRKGIAAILTPIWKSEIAQAVTVPGLLEIGFDQVCRTLVFIEMNQIHEFSQMPESASVVVVTDTEEDIMRVSADLKVISLRAEVSLFQDIVSEFKQEVFKSGNQENELTLREKEVLREVAMGYSNKEIADSLFISIHTVITHRKNITGKLGIRSISGLTVYAILNHLIDPGVIDPEKLI